MGIDYNKFKGPSAQKALETQATAPREAQGSGDVGYGIFDFADAPYPVKAWKPQVGKNVVLILPIEVTNKQNPAFHAGAIGMGEYDYGVSVTTHMGKGTAAGLSHVCLKRNYGKKCPRCEEFFLTPDKGGTFVKGVPGSGNPDHASSERNYFLVVPYSEDGKTPDTENVGIWNAPANSRSGFPVVERAKEMADGCAIVPFWWPTDEGRLVSFEAVMEGKWLGFKTLKFLKRDTAKVQELADKYSFPLDKHLIVKTADQITEDMFGGPEREAPPARESHREPEESHDTEESVDPDAFGAPEPEAEKEPEAPKAEAPKATADSKCPYGHNYGKDWGDTPDCKLCRKAHKATEAECAEGV